MLYMMLQKAGLAGWDESGNPVSTVLNLASRIASDREDSACEMRNRRPLSEIGVYAVVGCGPVGLLTIAAVRALLLWRNVHYDDILIFAIDSVGERLDHAARWGATPIKLGPIDTHPAAATAQDSNREDNLSHLRHDHSPEMVRDIIRAASLVRGRSGKGADAVLECVGAPSALRLAYDIAVPGGTLSSIGVHSTTFPFSPADIYDKNLTYRSGRCPARSMMPAAEVLLRWLRDSRAMRDSPTGNIRLGDIITHRMHLSRALEAYDMFDKKREGCLKPVLYPFELPNQTS
jgi:threonine dehydrogenase-like Zn-dependent dehydrogenase